jgi:hypothetical protein
MTPDQKKGQHAPEGIATKMVRVKATDTECLINVVDFNADLHEDVKPAAPEAAKAPSDTKTKK